MARIRVETIGVNMTIRNLARYGVGALMAILCVGGLLAMLRINEIRIGGPIATQLQEVNDLVADILPPPEYLVEPYLEATLLVNRPGDYEVRSARLAQLHKDYDARHAYWLESTLDPEIRAAVTKGSHDPAQAFWSELEGRLFPAIRAGNAAATAASYARLSQRFVEHRAMVDKAVAIARRQSDQLTNDAASELSWAIILMSGLAITVVVFAAGFGFVILSRIVRPLVEVGEATTRLAHGGSADVPHQAREDELGEIAKAVERFRLAAIARQEADRKSAEDQKLVTTTLGDSLSALAEGDLSAKVEVEFSREAASLKTNFNDAISRLGRIIGAVSQGAARIRAGSQEIARASEDLARRTEANAASLEETSAGLVQIDDRLKAITNAAARTVERADQAMVTVGGGRAIADEAALAMTRVRESATGIDSVIEGLDKIAFQTRVLAMNAAVEAGRAGDAGRGFAVVADLVSSLAMRAEEEAKRARGQLTVTQTDIVVAAEAVQRVDGALANISSDVGEVHGLLGQMAADNQAQSSAITQISVAISAMDRSTQQNAAMVEETSAAVRNLATEVTSLADQAALFKTG